MRRSFFLSLLASAALLPPSSSLIAHATVEPPPTREASPPVQPPPPPHLGGTEPLRRTNPDEIKWTVRVEVLMVEMPQEKALALLPELRDPQKIERAVQQIMEAIQRKEATLIGWPAVHVLNQDRGVSETVEEKRYPTEFDLLPEAVQRGMPSREKAIVDGGNALAASFETRNLGVDLEAEPTVLDDGARIHIEVAASHVSLLAFDVYDQVHTNSGRIAKIDAPRFSSRKTRSALILRNRQHELLAVHKLPGPENQMELFIIQAVATPVK